MVHDISYDPQGQLAEFKARQEINVAVRSSTICSLQLTIATCEGSGWIRSH